MSGSDMNKSILIKSLLAIGLLILAGCGGETPKQSDVKSDSELRRDSRLRVLEGRDMLPTELEALGQDFAENIERMTLNEAKQCRVSLYTESQHFKMGYPSGFDRDFREQDREQAEANFYTFLYYAIDEIVVLREREFEKKNITDAPESVQRQILREGKFHQTVESLARCKMELIPREDTDLPYFKLFCQGTDSVDRNVYERRIDAMQKYCEALGREYLENGSIDPDSYEKSPLVYK